MKNKLESRSCPVDRMEDDTLGWDQGMCKRPLIAWRIDRSPRSLLDDWVWVGTRKSRRWDSQKTGLREERRRQLQRVQALPSPFSEPLKDGGQGHTFQMWGLASQRSVSLSLWFYLNIFKLFLYHSLKEGRLLPSLKKDVVYYFLKWNHCLLHKPYLLKDHIKWKIILWYNPPKQPTSFLIGSCSQLCSKCMPSVHQWDGPSLFICSQIWWTWFTLVWSSLTLCNLDHVLVLSSIGLIVRRVKTFSSTLVFSSNPFRRSWTSIFLLLL